MEIHLEYKDCHGDWLACDKGAGPGHSRGSKCFWGHKNSQIMHIVGINFISFIAHNNALHMLDKKGDFWHLRGMASFPPKSAYKLGYPPLSLFSFLLPFLFFPVLLHFPLSFFSPFFSSVFLFPSFPLFPFRSKTPWIQLQGLGSISSLSGV